MSADIFSQLVINIVKEQENIIGPLAIEQAQKVPGLKLDWKNHVVTIMGDRRQVLEQLAKQYEMIFGRTSIEVCRTVVHKLIPQLSPDEIPTILQ